jgi:hypothetical protein
MQQRTFIVHLNSKCGASLEHVAVKSKRAARAPLQPERVNDTAQIGSKGAELAVPVNRNLLNHLNVIWVVQPSFKKYFAFAVGQISSTSSPRPFPARGADRDRHERGMGCGGRGSVGARVCSQGGFRE